MCLISDENNNISTIEYFQNLFHLRFSLVVHNTGSKHLKKYYKTDCEMINFEKNIKIRLVLIAGALIGWNHPWDHTIRQLQTYFLKRRKYPLPNHENQIQD